jgi:hypothetical protein
LFQVVTCADVDARLAASFELALALQFCRGFEHRAVRTKRFEVFKRRFAVGMEELEG